jgi:hypothetical protein
VAIAKKMASLLEGFKSAYEDPDMKRKNSGAGL